jgi:hypothetical protein
MYEDLVQAQQPSALERFVLTSLLPSLLVTSLLHAHTFWAEPARERIAKVEGEYIVTRPVPDTSLFGVTSSGVIQVSWPIYQAVPLDRADNPAAEGSSGCHHFVIFGLLVAFGVAGTIT